MLSVIQMHRKLKFCSVTLAILLLFSACAKRPHETKTIRPSDSNPVHELQNQLDQTLSNPQFDNAFWGVAIQSLDNGQMIYERNPGKLLVPASNMKLLTGIAALKTLGPDFTYETEVRIDGEIDEGTLMGDLIVIGHGDPTISSRFHEGNAFHTFQDWAQQLRNLGVSTIAGDIIAVDDAFDDERLGFGWSWDDLPYYYAAEVSALQFSENAITVTVIASADHSSVSVQKDPDSSYVMVVQKIQVVPNSEKSVKWSYDPESRTVFAEGTLPPGDQDYGSFAVHNPASYFVTALKETLLRNGIAVDGEAYRARDRKYAIPEDSRLLFTHRSPPLREILGVLLKVSQNLYAETLLKTLGKGSFAAGIQEVQRVLTELGIPAQNFIITDGSGLSRYSYITPRGLLHLLRSVKNDSNFEAFYNALAVAGKDGTLRSRMKGTSAENNVHAKTGSLSNVRSLSGYAHTRDGELMGFVMIANNFSAEDETVQQAQDTILQLLTGFRRSR